MRANAGEINVCHLRAEIESMRDAERRLADGFEQNADWYRYNLSLCYVDAYKRVLELISGSPGKASVPSPQCDDLALEVAARLQGPALRFWRRVLSLVPQ